MYLSPGYCQLKCVSCVDFCLKSLDQVKQFKLSPGSKGKHQTGICIWNTEHMSTNGKLVVWVGGLDVWNPLMKGIATEGVPRLESQTTKIIYHWLNMVCNPIIYPIATATT